MWSSQYRAKRTARLNSLSFREWGGGLWLYEAPERPRPLPWNLGQQRHGTTWRDMERRGQPMLREAMQGNARQPTKERSNV